METLPGTSSPVCDAKESRDSLDSKQPSDTVDQNASTPPVANGIASPVSTKSDGKGRFPPSQSPLVTLLQKKREGSLPSGAAYIGSPSTTDSVKLLTEVMDYLEKESASIIANSGGSNVTGNSYQASTLKSASGFRLSDRVPVLSRKQVFETLQQPNGDRTKKANDSQSQQRVLPRKIEDYEPGRSSIASLDPSMDGDYNPPIIKPGQFSRYIESDTEFEYRIRKKDQSMSPSQSDNSVHDLYRRVQRGGQIPSEGLKYPAVETKRAYSIPATSAHHSRLGHTLSDSGVTTLSRKERDQLNALRKQELNRLMEEGRRKKLEEERRDIQARRHSDFFMPSQKSPVPLNRYEENVDERLSMTLPAKNKTASKLRGKAKALYNFTAQSDRELSFRKGDVVYLIRQIDRNWFEGERHGRVGRFPVSYVELIISLDAAHAMAAENEGIARALYNFVAQSPVELSFKKGDLVRLIRRVDENWYEGRYGSRRGIFPVRYVEAMMEPMTPYLTPMTSRTVTPMLGSPATLSPSSSIFSIGPAPTIPSAPLSPVDSELMDEGKWSTEAELWCSSPHRWAVNLQPAIAASRHYDERHAPSDAPTPTRSLYYSSGGLDEPSLSAPVQPVRPLSRSSSAGPPGDNRLNHIEEADLSKTDGWSGTPRNSFAQNVQNLTSSYHFENGNGKESSMNRRLTAEGGISSHPPYPPYRARYKYVPRSSDELSLSVGDLVYVVEKCDDGWFVGFSERTKGFGTFPGNYVWRLW